MIQRPQTLLLTVSILLNSFLPFSATADRFYADPHGWWAYAFLSALILSTGSAAFSISLFKTRPNQARWIFRSILFQCIVAGLAVGVIASMGAFSESMVSEAISASLASLALILLWVARRQVLRDEALVNSIDRIR